jgi:hypothetical protein
MGKHGGAEVLMRRHEERRREGTEEAEVLMQLRGNGDALGQRGVASWDKGTRTRAGRGGGVMREVGRCQEVSGAARRSGDGQAR